MSLYSQLFGIDPLASFLLNDILHIDPKTVARFRDCYLGEDGRVVILTRTGGGNREEYASSNESLAQHRDYVGDEDAGEDSTYAYFYFDSESVVKAYGRRPAIERFMELTKKLGDPECKDDPDVVLALEVGRELVEQIQGALKTATDSPHPLDNVTIIEV